MDSYSISAKEIKAFTKFLGKGNTRDFSKHVMLVPSASGNAMLFVTDGHAAITRELVGDDWRLEWENEPARAYHVDTIKRMRNQDTIIIERGVGLSVIELNAFDQTHDGARPLPINDNCKVPEILTLLPKEHTHKHSAAFIGLAPNLVARVCNALEGCVEMPSKKDWGGRWIFPEDNRTPVYIEFADSVLAIIMPCLIS